MGLLASLLALATVLQPGETACRRSGARAFSFISRDPQPLERHRLKVLKALEKKDLVLCGEGAPSGQAIVMPLKTSESVRYAARELLLPCLGVRSRRVLNAGVLLSPVFGFVMLLLNAAGPAGMTWNIPS